MRVEIECEKCGARTEVHMHGGWDIQDVKHLCASSLRRPGIPSMRSLPGSGDFAITFNPPRRAF